MFPYDKFEIRFSADSLMIVYRKDKRLIRLTICSNQNIC